MAEVVLEKLTTGSRVTQYGGAVLGVVLATLGTFGLQSWMEPSISLLFYPAVVIPAMYGGYGPALVATILSTGSLAFFFIQPLYSFNLGVDDLIRLAVFVLVAVATASVSSARKRAEDALRGSLSELQSAHDTLRKVSGWPVMIQADSSSGLRRTLLHAAAVVGAAESIAVWEAEEEPWVYAGASAPDGNGVVRHPPLQWTPLVADELAETAFVWIGTGSDRCLVSSGQQAGVREWFGQAINVDFVPSLGSGSVASAPFRTEHLAGRVFFSGIVRATGDVLPIVALVAREVGNSLDQLYLADRMQRLAAREERIRLARDLHDGVLQSLTGIRLAIQTMASDVQEQAAAKDRLLAIERAIAIEQRELRLFISDIRPETPSSGDASSLVEQLEEMCGRLRLEWKAPIKIRVSPAVALTAANERVLRLMIHEAIVNALKHGHPSRVTVDVHERGEGTSREMVVAVSDDGRGFSFRGRVEHDTLVDSRLGPASLLDRVVGLGGRMSIESNPSGARVEFVLPAPAGRG